MVSVVDVWGGSIQNSSWFLNLNSWGEWDTICVNTICVAWCSGTRVTGSTSSARGLFSLFQTKPDNLVKWGLQWSWAVTTLSIFHHLLHLSEVENPWAFSGHKDWGLSHILRKGRGSLDGKCTLLFEEGKRIKGSPFISPFSKETVSTSTGILS